MVHVQDTSGVKTPGPSGRRSSSVFSSLEIKPLSCFLDLLVFDSWDLHPLVVELDHFECLM